MPYVSSYGVHYPQMNGIGAGDEAAGIEAAELMQLSPWHLDRGEDIMRYHPSRRDDMFRLAQMLCRLSSPTYREAEDSVYWWEEIFYSKFSLPGAASMWARFKRRSPPDVVHQTFRAFYEYTLSLKFGEPPAYDYWAQIFNAEHSSRNPTKDYPFVKEYLSKIDAATRYRRDYGKCLADDLWLVGVETVIHREIGSNVIVQNQSTIFEFGKFIMKMIYDSSSRWTFVQLGNEKLVLKILRDLQIIPKLFEIDIFRSGLSESCEYKTYVTLNYGKILDPKNKVSMIAVEGLRILKELHATGFAHGDIHFKNFLLDTETSSKLQLIDFGLTRPFIDATGKHIPFGSFRTEHLSGFNLALLSPWHLRSGNVEGYMSTARDDIYRFAEMLYILSSKEYRSAWLHLNYESSVQGWYELKMSNRTFEDVPAAFTAFHKYARSLRFNQVPEYDRWIAEFLKEI